MIYVSKRQLDQVEYLIHQSIQGNHVLFDRETIRSVLRSKHEDAAEGIQIEPIIESLILEPTLERKRAFLEGLDKTTYERVIRTYFNIVENNLLESKKVLH